ARTPQNFYASWASGPLGLASDDGTATFTLPRSAWSALAGADRLYYRVLTSADRWTWAGVRRSYPGGRTAPFIQLKGRTIARPEAVRYRSEERRWREDWTRR